MYLNINWQKTKYAVWVKSELQNKNERNQSRTYIFRLHSNVFTELLHALWTHHIITTYF